MMNCHRRIGVRDYVKRHILIFTFIILFFSSFSFAFYLHVGQDKAEVIAAIGEANYIDESVDSTGKMERCQWGSERAGVMVVIWFKNGKVIKFETKGKVR